MPFQSEAQRRYMHMHHPETAKKWEKKEESGEYKSRLSGRRKAIAKRLQKNRSSQKNRY